MFLEKKPIIIAAKIPNIFGSLTSTKLPKSLKKTEGNIIAGNTVEGT